tara:strand:- start:470782 stop:471219 length:438 start_codon:yes stop_codon:yes gene_type:complete
MPRRTVTLPDTFLYATQYSVVYSDVNSANHLGADRVLPIAMEAQLRFIKHLGYHNATVFEDAGLIMAHAETQYLAEADYGDHLKIEVAVTDLTQKSFDLVYRITNLTKRNEMSRLRTTMLFFDYQSKQVIAVPDTFLDKLSEATP